MTVVAGAIYGKKQKRTTKNRSLFFCFINIFYIFVTYVKAAQKKE